MAHSQLQLTVPEIEFLRRRLGKIASSATGLPDQVLQKFDRLLVIAHDLSLQHEAVRLASELFEFINPPPPPRGRSPRRSNQPVSVTVRLHPSLATALDKFMTEIGQADSRAKAVKIILEDALKDYGPHISEMREPQPRANTER